MLAALAIEVWLQTYAKQGIPALYADHVLGQYTIAAMTEQIEAKSSHVWVASNIDPTLGDALLGYLVWEEQATAPFDACPASEITTLYIRERHKRLGLGSALLQACYREAVGRGLDALFLTVNDENMPAIAFYRHMGFEEIGEDFFTLQSERYRNLVLQKRI